jgi:hypothetical protein
LAVSVLGEARRLVRPLAGPAFRRTFRLYDGIGQQLRLIRSKRRYVTEWNRPTVEAIDSVLELLELQAREQLRTSNDAVEEWSVLLPKEVRELRSAAEDLDVD